MKIALLSNVNVDYVAKQLESKYDVCPLEGYGDIWGKMLNKASSLNQFMPEVICIIIDISMLLDKSLEVENMYTVIDEWFDMFKQLQKSEITYFVSDVKIRGFFISDIDEQTDYKVERYWSEKLEEVKKDSSNVHILRIGKLIDKYGNDKFYSNKTWYLGKIPYSMEGNKLLSIEIDKKIKQVISIPKKVLVLDLDNTLWGGVIGETGVEGVCLSDDKVGLIYRECQIMIKQMQRRGVLLAICSKNNETDVEPVWEHPHMILKKEDFVCCKINWEDKSKNIREIAKELNLGLDSFVFVDDMPNEREGIRSQIPEVIVPEFPNMLERLPQFYKDVYDEFFAKCNMTQEDRIRTRQYLENAEREKSRTGVDFPTFLKNLMLRPKRVEMNEKVKSRVVQLMNKTNQFNLTTIRYTECEIERMMKEGWLFYVYSVSDKFGDYGIVAVVLVEPQKGHINSFIMSCRIMGKELEKYFIKQVEDDLRKKGYKEVYASYIPTQKNKPTESLYENLGYEVLENKDGCKEYRLDLNTKTQRIYYVIEENKE